MTDQEKADLELSLALIDQAASSEQVTAANVDLKDATHIEVDASLNLTDSKERVTDQMNDLEYSLSEQNRAEKRYLNVLDRRLEIEKKIGLVDYSQIDKDLHRKITEELQARLKAEQEKNKQKEKEDEEEEETDQKRIKSDAEYLKEAEKFHKKRVSMFKKISDAQKNYMQNSSSFTGRLAVGALGKGTSELTSLIDTLTDQVPGMKTAKAAGGFIRDQWRGAREEKRQKDIQRTAGFLKAKDVSADNGEKLKQKDRDKDQKKGTEGILETAGILGKIFGFLKKMSEMMMLMGIFKGIFSLMGGAIAGLGGIISTAFSAALGKLGIPGLIAGLTSVLSGIAGALGLKDIFKTKPTTQPDSKKTTADPKKSPDELEKEKNKKDKPKAEERKPNEKPTKEKPKTETKPSKPSKPGGTSFMKGLAGGALRLVNVAGMTVLAVEGFDALETAAMQSDMSKEQADEVNANRAEAKETYVDSTGHNRELYDKKGNIQFYHNLENDPKKAEENRRRYEFAMDQQGKEYNEEEMKQMIKAVDDQQRAELNKWSGFIQANSGLSASINNTTYNNQTTTKQLTMSPNERTSRNVDSRGGVTR